MFESLDDPPAGYAATANHAPHRQPQRPNQPPAPVYTINDPVYREPSTWETMIRVELAADELQRAVALVKRLEMRAFPEAGEFFFVVFPSSPRPRAPTLD